MKGTGTEYMLVKLVDRVRNLLDKDTNMSSVIAVAVDWVSAFYKIDGTIAIARFIAMGLRSSLVTLLTTTSLKEP